MSSRYFDWPKVISTFKNQKINYFDINPDSGEHFLNVTNHFCLTMQVLFGEGRCCSKSFQRDSCGEWSQVCVCEKGYILWFSTFFSASTNHEKIKTNNKLIVGQKLLKRHHWAALLHWVTFVTKNTHTHMQWFLLTPHTSCSPKYCPEHQMWINPRLKIGLDKFTTSSYLIKTALEHKESPNILLALDL